MLSKKSNWLHMDITLSVMASLKIGVSQKTKTEKTVTGYRFRPYQSNGI